jgi:hypothetical protein
MGTGMATTGVTRLTHNSLQSQNPEPRFRFRFLNTIHNSVSLSMADPSDPRPGKTSSFRSQPYLEF